MVCSTVWVLEAHEVSFCIESGLVKKGCCCDVDQVKSYPVHHHQFCPCVSVPKSFPSQVGYHVRDTACSAIILSHKSGSSSLYCFQLVDVAVRVGIPS